MRICVLIKQLPDTGSALKIRADELWVDEDNLVFSANESDSYALEEALLMKEAQGGEVVVVSLGPERVGQVLKDALAKGADRAIHLHDPAWEVLDSLGLARIMAAVLKEEQCDLIFTGLQSDDTGDGQLGPMLAELLDMPHVTLVVETELSDGRIKVKQELEGGWFQYVTAQLPVLLTIQSGINKPRYASLRGIMAMKHKEIKAVGAGDLDLPADQWVAGRTLQRLYVPEKTKETVFLEGSPQEVGAALVDHLVNTAKVF